MAPLFAVILLKSAVIMVCAELYRRNKGDTSLAGCVIVPSDGIVLAKTRVGSGCVLMIPFFYAWYRPLLWVVPSIALGNI